MLREVAALALLVAIAMPAGAREAPRVPLRVGTHADHGRLVFDWPLRADYSVTEADDRLVIRFAEPAALDLSAGRRATRNLVSVTEEDGAVVVRAAPGSRIRHFRLGNRVVVDLLDAAPRAEPPALSEAPPAARPAPPSSRPAPRPAEAPPPPPAPSEAPTPAPRPAPAPPVTAEAAPARPAPQPEPAPARPPAPAAPALQAAGAAPIRPLRDAHGISVPAGAEAGLALFRRGDAVFAVIDRAVPFDVTALRRHPVFSALEVIPAQEATLLRLPLPGTARLQARLDGSAWLIEATRDPAPPDAPALRVATEPGPPARLLVQGGIEAGGVVTLPDPETGEALIVATLRRPGPGIALPRRLPELDILPSMVGAVVLARSDRVVVRALNDRLVVEAAAGGALTLGAVAGREPPAQVLGMSRLLDLPVGPVPALMERLRVQLLAVQDAAPLSRGPSRRDAAETLIALGLPQEAQAMAGLALREDPRARDDARLILAGGVAALLAGRLSEAGGIEDARLPANDEVGLWRALLAAAQGNTAAAAGIGAGAPLLLAYPDALRDRVLPQAIEAMAAGGEAAGAARLLAQAGEMPGLELARAMVLEAAGQGQDAVAAYEAVARGRDRRQRGAALRRAAELRLAQGAIDAAGAARALEQALFAWRGGMQELALRRRIAALRLRAGQGADAFALLEETARFYPEDAPALRAEMAEAFAAALRTAPPAMAATLFDAHPDLLPQGEAGEATILLLADRLAALDLPRRAATLLEQAAARANPEMRAGIGVRLAAMRLAEGDAAGTIAALDGSAAADLPESLAQRRTLLRARALARRGERAEADSLLASLGPAGAEARADLRAEAQDWTAAAAAQLEHVAAILPPAPAPLDPAQRAALARAAAFAALAGDEALLAGLRESHGARMAEGPMAEAFAVLTSDPLRGIADLPRLQREIGMLRVMPARLEALRGGVQVAR